MKSATDNLDPMDIFHENMEVLQSASTRSAELISQTPLSGELQAFRSATGHPNVLVPNGSGKGYCLHSPKDPMREAEALLVGKKFLNGDATILFGFGIGYLVKEIQERMSPAHDLFVIEQRPDILKMAMHCLDLREVFRDGRIRICSAVDSFSLIERLKDIQLKIICGTVNKLMYGPSTNLAPDQYQSLEQDIDAYVAEVKNGIGSFKGQIPTRIENLFNNIPVMLESAPVTGLKGLFTHRPAIIVAAGPSLDKNIERLKQATNRAVIIAVDAALKPLLSAGTVPDIVATVETHGDNQKKFEGLSPRDLKDITLVFDPECTPHAPLNFPGPGFFTNTQNTFSNWIVGQFGDPPDFPLIYTVSHLAFHLAKYLGCSPIILAGFDLSFPNDKHHSSGSALTWAPDFQRGDFLEIKDIFGNKVKTLDQFLFMLRLLEREINKTKALCIDATEGGAFIRGTKIMPMSDAFKEYLPEEAFNIEGCLWSRYSSSMPQETTPLKRGLDWLMSEIGYCDGIIEQAQTLMQEAMPINHQNKNESPNSCDIGAHLRGLRDKILEKTEFFNVLGDLLTDLLISENRFRFAIADEKATPNGNIPDDIGRYEHFFGEMAKTIGMLKQHCTDLPDKTITGSL